MQRRRWPLWTYYVVAVFIFALDYVTKKIIDRNIEMYTERINVIGDFFQIAHIRNRGAAFGILENQRWLFIIITIVVVGLLIGYLHRLHRANGRRMTLFALGMILGGALGNFIDRSRSGEVVDFLQFNFGSYTFPLFNVADIGITCGVALFILDTLLTPKQENKPHDNGEQPRDSASEQPSA